MRRRLIFLFAIAAALAAAVILAPHPGGSGIVEASSPATPPQHTTRVDRTKAKRDLTPTPRAEALGDAGNIFATPPAPVFRPARARTVVEPVAPLPAPVLPFRFLGRYSDGTSTGVFLGVNERNLALTAGDVVDETFKVERIEADHVIFTHLPTNQEMRLSLAEGVK